MPTTTTAERTVAPAATRARPPACFTLSADVHAALAARSRETDASKSRLAERALRLFLGLPTGARAEEGGAL